MPDTAAKTQRLMPFHALGCVFRATMTSGTVSSPVDGSRVSTLVRGICPDGHVTMLPLVTTTFE